MKKFLIAILLAITMTLIPKVNASYIFDYGSWEYSQMFLSGQTELIYTTTFPEGALNFSMDIAPTDYIVPIYEDDLANLIESTVTYYDSGDNIVFQDALSDLVVDITDFTLNVDLQDVFGTSRVLAEGDYLVINIGLDTTAFSLIQYVLYDTIASIETSQNYITVKYIWNGSVVNTQFIVEYDSLPSIFTYPSAPEGYTFSNWEYSDGTIYQFYYLALDKVNETTNTIYVYARFTQTIETNGVTLTDETTPEWLLSFLTIIGMQTDNGKALFFVLGIIIIAIIGALISSKDQNTGYVISIALLILWCILSIAYGLIPMFISIIMVLLCVLILTGIKLTEGGGSNV